MNRAIAAFKSSLNAGLGLLYPEVCNVCHDEPAAATDGYVGAQCRRKVHFIEPPFCERCGLPFPGNITNSFECANCREMELHFSSARSAVSADTLVRDVIHGYKYNRALWFEPFLAELLVRAAVPVLAREKCDLLVPVPLHAAKQREREFNQAERLGRHLSRAAGIDMNIHLLQRVQPTETQTKLTREQRSKNVQHAFAQTVGAKKISGRVLLFDDVFTTGATTSACARILRSLGADDVCVWTVARGL
jgi:ComF family protein